MNARADLINFLVKYGGRCRDCADEDGFCPQTGIGCGQRRKAVEFVLGALDYGSKHGYAAGYRLLAPGELDRETVEAAAKVAGEHATNAWEIARQNGENDVCASGRNHAGRSIAAAIRSLKEPTS